MEIDALPQFKTETLFQQAVAQLLVRMPGISGVQILHGPQEVGKDIIFEATGPLGERTLCACVVKNTKITGAAGGPDGARTLFHQAEQALDTPHIDERARPVSVQKVYVITPFSLSPSTISSISGKLNRGEGQIDFIGGPKLVDLFKLHWPTYLEDEANLLSRHFSGLSKYLSSDTPLNQLASEHNLGAIDRTPKQVYVPTTFQRTLYAYICHSPEVSFLPTQSKLKEPLSLEDIRGMKSQIKALAHALAELTDWPFDPRIEVSGDLIDKLKRLAQKLDDSWQERVSISGKDPLSEDTTVKLRSLSTLVGSVDYIGAALNRQLEPLRRLLAKSNEMVESDTIDGIEALTHPGFLLCCSLNEFASTTPPGLLRRTGSRTITFPEDLLDTWSGPLMIVGAPGYGKTSFCRWHALGDIERFNIGKATVLPVYVPIHKLSRGLLPSFENVLLSYVGALLAATSDTVVAKGQAVRFYLDGLDEVPAVDRRRAIIGLVRAAAETHSNYQMIVTARDYVVDGCLAWLPRISISGFERKHVHQLVTKWLGPESAPRFFRELKKTPSLNALMTTPLLATLILLIYRQTKRLPENKGRLYELFVDLLLGGWDLAKGILRESKFGRLVKLIVLKRIARTLHEEERREFNESEIAQAARLSVAADLAGRVHDLAQEIVQDGLVVRSGSVYQFCHLSFQEFLVAKDFHGDPHTQRIEAALRSFLLGTGGWWREALKFYMSLAADPKRMATWVLDQADAVWANGISGQIRRQCDDLFVGLKETYPDFDVDGFLSRRSS